MISCQRYKAECHYWLYTRTKRYDYKRHDSISDSANDWCLLVNSFAMVSIDEYSRLFTGGVEYTRCSDTLSLGNLRLGI